ncbi:hypothetical protein NHX12_002323 [Muraenolepis orangiensis]|uniref:VWFA domain-containing protein n=1 Tax=Muraenolepis orangiensis TaxID=630683 RepID=A0A9Q0DWP1_9TELE|nr:hypothetical protein NHX12_002323 [Muraenolepis orangiensis]
MLVGAPFEVSGGQRTGDVYRCPLDVPRNCSRLHLGRMSLENVSERKDQMNLGMTLTSNPKDQSFVTCGPLWSHECGSSFYSTGICSRCETFMDIVIVLDGSNSIYPWYEVQTFLINILQSFYMGRGQTQVGVVQYGSRVVHEFTLSDYHSVEEVVAAARKVEQRGGEETRTALGINVARQEAFQRGGRSGARKVMIVITDGESHDSSELPLAVQLSRKDNITMYAIAEIRFIASDPDDQHFFKVTDESALKDIVGALGERIFSIEGTNTQGRRFGLQMAQAGFSTHLVQDGVLVGAVGAYDWNGAVLKETQRGKVIPPRSSYLEEFPDDLQNHAAYLGYAVGSMVTARKKQLYVAGAPRFNHTGKVIVFTMKNTGHLSILHTLPGQQIGSYFGSELTSVDLDGDGDTDVLLVAAPMYYSQGWERGRVYMYSLSPQNSLALQGVLEVTERAQNSRLGSALAAIPDMNGDGFGELVVGAPLEDDHRGALYIFYGESNKIQRTYKQKRFVLDLNSDGLVDLSVGALGGVVTLWSRSVLRIGSRVTFEPEKVNVFNKDCQRGGKQRRVPPRAVLDQSEDKMLLLSLLPGHELCQPISFYVQETADYGRPILVVMETGLQTPDDGPVLDPDWPSVLRTEPVLWYERQGAGPAWGGGVAWRAEQASVSVVESKRRRVVVSARLENSGENAYGPALFLSHSHNLLLSSILVKDQSHLQLECQAELANQRRCNISAPFMRSKAQLSFHVEFEFSPLVFLDHLEVVIETSSEGVERNPADNVNHLYLPLKYEVDLLFTRYPYTPVHQVQNLAVFPVSDLLLLLNVWAETFSGTLLLNITHYSTQPKVKFRSLEMLTSSYLQLDLNSSLFLEEDRPTRLVVLGVRKEVDYQLPLLVVLGSLGFFKRRTRKEAEEGAGPVVTNEKMAENLL